MHDALDQRRFTGTAAGARSSRRRRTAPCRSLPLPITVVLLGTLLVAACLPGPYTADDGAASPVAGRSGAVRHALEVDRGTCPPGVARYHAHGSSGSTELQVVTPGGQIVAYLIESNDPLYDGRRDRAVVRADENGHTFAITVPVAAIVSVLVSASGNADEVGGTCRVGER